MFFIGGAGKKKALREIFKVSPEELKKDTRDVDSDNDEDGDTARPRSKSRSRSRSRISNTTDNDDMDTDTDTDTDTGSDQDATIRELEDNHDYIATIGSIDTAPHNHSYKFVEDELDYDIEEFADKHQEIRDYTIVIYRINTKSTLPFLEFLFYCEDSLCKLPNYKHVSKKHIRKETDNIMDKLFTTKYRYKGFLHDELTDKCFVFYEKYFRQEMAVPVLASLQQPHNWYWVCTTEIIDQEKYMSIPIDDTAVDLFVAYPTIGLLQANIPNVDVRVRVRRHTHSNERFQTVHIEAPTILYYGSTLCYAQNTALYGLKREPLMTRFGPFYYFTTLDHSFYWACYHNTSRNPNSGSDIKERNKEGGISRYAVFTKRMKTVFKDDDYNEEMVKKYVERKNIFETKINQFRQTQEIYHPGMYDSIYSYDYSWTTKYDTIYNGYYHIKKLVRPVWCVCDHRHFQLLSYYEVNTDNIPITYDPTFSDYTLL